MSRSNAKTLTKFEGRGTGDDKRTGEKKLESDEQ
jgi:hypothetical protein